MLFVDGNGRRRAAFEAAAAARGHHTYSAGSIEEALRLAEIYGPEVVAVTGIPEGGGEEALVSALRASAKSTVSGAVVVSGTKSPAGRAGDFVGEVEAALSASPQAA